MSSLHKSALVPYSAASMYELVNDIETYPEFIPWCTAARVIKREALQLEATIVLSKGMMGQQFTTRNTMVPGSRIEMDLVDGPLERLQGVWYFEQLGDLGCKVSLDMDFDLAKGVLGLAFGKVFTRVADKLVDAFCQRARQQYGDG